MFHRLLKLKTDLTLNKTCLATIPLLVVPFASLPHTK
jgi:hypothetical protein